MYKNFLCRSAVVATLAASYCVVASIQPSHAQTPFTFNNGYDQTLNANGTVTGGTQYTYVTSTGNGPNGGNLSDVQNPYNTIAGTNTLTSGGRGTAFTERGGNGFRIASSFDVPPGFSVRLTSMTVYAYVNGVSTAVNPFSAAHFAIYNASPNTFAGNAAGLAAATVAGDSTFTQNYLRDASFSGTYRTQSAAAGTALETNPADRPIFNINMDLTRQIGGTGTVSSVTLTSGRYYLAYSVDINPTFNPNNFDVFAVLASPTLTTGETLNGKNYNGQPGRTDGSAQSYRAGSWDTDQPVYNGAAGAPVILDGFPFTLTGNIVGAEVPEPGSVALLFSVGLVTLPAALRHRRKR